MSLIDILFNSGVERDKYSNFDIVIIIKIGYYNPPTTYALKIQLALIMPRNKLPDSENFSGTIGSKC